MQVRDLHRVEHLLYGRPDFRSLARFVHPRLATLLKKCRAFGSQGIAGEKQHTFAQIGMLMAQHVIEIDPIESWHTQITQHDVIALRVQLPQGEVPIGRRVHGIAIPAQELGQPMPKTLFIINHLNPPRSGRGSRRQTQSRGRCCILYAGVTEGIEGHIVCHREPPSQRKHALPVSWSPGL